MTVKKKAGRPLKKKVIKETMPIEQKTEESKQEEFVDLFPDRTPIYGEELYEDPDATRLTKDGKDWNPREHGWEVRLMDPSTIEHLGYRGYKPVPKSSNIRFKRHPLADSDFGDGSCGEVVSTLSRDNRVVREEMLGKELADHFELRAKDPYVKIGKLVLCLAPLEKPTARRKLAVNIANSSLRKDLQKADEQAQEELGNSKTHGKFTLGETASRSWNERDAKDKTKTVRKVWSVPAQIK
ncbi:MAG: hypothetical protein ACFE9S_07680 [Candidatus Hermodarchaeota archaeon]